MIVDGHVHLVGDESLGHGCRIQLRTAFQRLGARIMLRGIGLSPDLIRTGGLGKAYVERLLETVRSSSIDRALLLAHDYPRKANGEVIDSIWNFYVSNDAVLDLARKHGEFFAAASIHPARPDALDELERVHAAGARVMKLLPNCLNIDYSLPQYRRFFRRMGELGVVLLSHSGGEHTVPETCHAFADPRLLVHPLEQGVTVIAAHAGGKSALVDPDWSRETLSLLREWPDFYVDNSALVSLNRWPTLGKLREEGIIQRVIHGSDYPVPVFPVGARLAGLIDTATWLRLRAIANPLERDWQTKLACGFPADCGSRLAKVAGLE